MRAIEYGRHTRGQRGVCTVTCWPAVNGSGWSGAMISTAMSSARCSILTTSAVHEAGLRAASSSAALIISDAPAW